MKIVSKSLVLVLVLALMLCAIPAAFAATGTGTENDPYVYTEIPSEPITVPAMGEVFVTLPAGGKQLNVTAAGEGVVVLDANIAGPWGYMEYGFALDGETLPVVLSEYEVGADVTLILQGGYEMDTLVTFELTEIEKGLEVNPDNAADYFFAGTGAYVLNKDLEADDSDGYFWSFTVPEGQGDKTIAVYTSPKDGFEDVEYSLELTYLMDDITIMPSSIDGNPVTTYRLPEGAEVSIHLFALMDDETWTIPALGAYVELCLVDGDDADPVSVKNRDQSTGEIVAMPFEAYVNAGAAITYCDGNSFSNTWIGKGIKVTTKSLNDEWELVPDLNLVAQTKIIMNGVEYTDKDGDGYIEFMAAANEDGNFEITIDNGSEENNKYIVEFVAEASEDVEAVCTHELMEHEEAVEVGCHQNGMMEYWYCPDCDCYFTDAEGENNIAYLSLTIPYDAENIVHVDAVDPCHANGMKEYWQCTVCEAIFADENLATLTNTKYLTILATEELEHVEAYEPGCHQNGMKEHWYCAVCDCYFADAEGQQNVAYLSLVIPYDAENIVHVDAVAPCHANGMEEYWQCTVCEAIFADEALTKLTNTKALTILATMELEHVEAYEPGCHQNGMKEHWYCAGCDCYFADAEGKQNVASLSLAIPFDTANIIHVDAVAPCHTNGMEEYWQCTVCEAIFADEALTKLTNVKALTILANTELEHVEGYEAGCHQNGMMEHWYCAGCDCYFTDAEGKQNVASLSLVIPFDASHIEYVPYKAATETEDGNYEYWHCTECHAIFTDAELTQLSNIKNVTIPAGSVADTGDVIMLAVLGAMMSTTGLVVLGKKKH